MTGSRREFLALTLGAVSGVATAARAGEPPGAAAPDWKIQRLSWAGLRVEGRASSLFLDPWLSPAIWDGGWTKPVIPIEASTARRAVLLTHLHNDHFDATAVRQVLGESGVVIAAESMAVAVASRGLRVRSVPLYQPEPWGDFVAIPVPASDGFGDDQVSWVVVAGERRLFHGGDTQWHGRFDRLGRAYGPFDLAFLPVNGAIVGGDAPAVETPRTLMPRQAVAAAELLRARMLVPIHYGFSDSTYREQDAALDTLREAARGRPLSLRIVEEGAWL